MRNAGIPTTTQPAQLIASHITHPPTLPLFLVAHHPSPPPFLVTPTPPPLPPSRPGGNLDLISGIYNNIQTTLLDIERPLVQKSLDSILKTLQKALTTLNWNSQKIDDYIQEVRGWGCVAVMCVRRWATTYRRCGGGCVCVCVCVMGG